MNGRSTRVLFVGAFPPPHRDVFGGMVSSCRALLQSSFAQRVDLDLIDSTQISNPPPVIVIRSLLAAQRLVRYVWRFERRRPDAVLLFAAIGASLIEKGAMAWYARLRGVPALIFPRGGIIIDAYARSRVTRWWVTIAFSGARKVLCQSEKWQRFAVDMLGFHPEQAPVITNWTASPELLAIGSARKPRSNGRPRLLFLGWLDREKGVGELLEACRALAATREFTLEFAGEGNQSDAARSFVAQYELGSVIMFSGWLRGDGLLSALASADVLVLPSWAEGLPNAMIEAMAARIAVVVTSVGSVPDVVVDGEHVLLVPPRDIPSLEAALARVIDDVPLRHRLADSGFALAAARFGAERAADQIVGELRSAVTRISWRKFEDAS